MIWSDLVVTAAVFLIVIALAAVAVIASTYFQVFP